MFDVAFSCVAAYFGYHIFDAFWKGKRIVIESPSSCMFREFGVRVDSPPDNPPKRIYDLKEMYSVKQHMVDVSPWYEYHVESNLYKDSLFAPLQRSSTPTPSCLHDVFSPGEEETYYELPSPCSMSHLEEEEHRGYTIVMREMAHSANAALVNMLPKDPQLGKIMWIKRGYGMIRTVDPFLSMHEFFFHPSELSGKQGDGLSVGDRVLFSLSVSGEKLLATGVKRAFGRTISSPDFSRLVMRRSHPIEVDAFEL